MIIQEVKKLFAVKRLVLIFALGALFYMIFFSKNVGIPTYSSERVHIDVSEELVHTYGNELDEEEYRTLVHRAASDQESQIDVWIKQNSQFREYGIESYRDLLNIQDSLSDAVGSNLTSQISQRFTEEEQQAALDQIWRENYIDGLVEAYDREARSGDTTSYYTELSEKERLRLHERNQEEVYSLMPDRVVYDFLSILPDFTIFLIISVVFLVVPYSVKDTVEGVNPLQYGARNGVMFFWKKGLAVLISALLLCMVQSGLLLFMLYQNDALPFMGCFVSGFGSSFVSFGKLTFGQYVGFSIGYHLLLGLSVAMIAYCLSSCANNYISAIAMQIPIVVAGIVFALLLMPHFAEITQNRLLLFGILAICVFGAAAGNMARFLSIKRYDRI